MRPMDILKRPAPKADAAPPKAAAPQTVVKPPQIPPLVPTPPKGGEYARLMKRHDRVTTRHVK